MNTIKKVILFLICILMIFSVYMTIFNIISKDGVNETDEINILRNIGNAKKFPISENISFDAEIDLKLNEETFGELNVSGDSMIDLEKQLSAINEIYYEGIVPKIVSLKNDRISLDKKEIKESKKFKLLNNELSVFENNNWKKIHNVKDFEDFSVKYLYFLKQIDPEMKTKLYQKLLEYFDVGIETDEYVLNIKNNIDSEELIKDIFSVIDFSSVKKFLMTQIDLNKHSLSDKQFEGMMINCLLMSLESIDNLSIHIDKNTFHLNKISLLMNANEETFAKVFKLSQDDLETKGELEVKIDIILKENL